MLYYCVALGRNRADHGVDLFEVEIMPKYEITKGSIADLMKNEEVSLAESFMTCDCIVLFDVSGSMGRRDNMLRTRFERGVKELKDIQEAQPRRYAVIQFGSRVDFMPGGVPVMGISGGTTNLTDALKYAQIADEIPGMRFIVISDGEPDNRITALAAAAQYQNRIDTVFIGAEDDRCQEGQNFLIELARMSGGRAMSTMPEDIGKAVTLLLSERAGKDL